MTHSWAGPGSFTILDVESGILIGRAGELAVLADLLAAVTGGAGGVVLVEGEQGIGKTTLLRAALGEVEAAGCRLGWAAADELVQRVPLRLMAECVRGKDWPSASASGDRAGPGLVAPVGDPVLAGMEALLARVDRLCGVSPVVLVAEDLQWADEASLVAWQRLARAVGQLPLLLAGSWRPGPGSAELARLRRGAAQAGRVVELEPLEKAEVGELAGRLAGGRAGRRLTEAAGQSGGNPLYARELVDALVRDDRVQVADGVAELTAGPVPVPGSLAAAVAQRLAGLPGDTLDVLRWAAVVGLEFTDADLAAVSGQPPGRLLELTGDAVAGQLLMADGPRLRFRHALIRQVIYEQMPVSLRVALHRQAAQLLAGAGAAAGRVAAHLDVALEAAAGAEVADPWMLRWLAPAVPELVHTAPQMAADLLRAALGQLAGDDPQREDFEAALINTAYLLMRDDEVEQVGRRILARTRDPDRAAEANWLLAQTLGRAQRPGDAAAAITVALTRPGISPMWTARLRALQAFLLAWDDQVDQAADVAAAALAAAEQAGDALARGYAEHALANVSYSRHDDAARLAHTNGGLAAIGDDPGAIYLRIKLLIDRSDALEYLDHRAEAMAAVRQAQELAEQVGTAQINAAHLQLAVLQIDAGQWDEVLAEAETMADLPVNPWQQQVVHALLGQIAVHRDDPATAGQHLRALPHPDQPGIFWENADLVMLPEALLAERAGDSRRAADTLAVCLQPEADEQLPNRYKLLPTLTRLSLDIGDTAVAAAAAQAAAADAKREPVPRKIAPADHCRGLIDGDPAPVLAAAAYYESAGLRLEQAKALEDAAALAAARGDTRAARQAFTGAVRLYAGMGAALDIHRADARLRRYGIRRAHRAYQPRPASGWDALTPTEVTIARLVAAGRSNPDIATELFLSRSTVQTHVSHILAKLGQRSRAQIAVAAFQHAAPRT
jgi:DNA-binding CsgD family transcriptional regulator